MKECVVFCPAKLNLTLAITGVLPNGYHELVMHNVTLDLGDFVRVREGGGVHCTMDGISVGEENSAFRAAATVCKEWKLKGLDVDIKKGIPIGGGLGGSSADAAGVLFAGGELFGSREKCQMLAPELGADLPYMLMGGGARVRGFGEIVEKRQSPMLHFVLLHAGEVSSKEAYRLFDQAPLFSHEVPELFALPQDEWHKVTPQNALKAAACKLCPQIECALQAIADFQPIFSGMTGSGGGVFGVFPTRAKAEQIAAKLAQDFPTARAASTGNGLRITEIG